MCGLKKAIFEKLGLFFFGISNKRAQTVSSTSKRADPQAEMSETICSHLSHTTAATLLISSLEDLLGDTVSVSCFLLPVLRLLSVQRMVF